MAYCRASLIDLYLHTKFHSNRRNFLWTDGRTDGRRLRTDEDLRTDIHTNVRTDGRTDIEAGFIRST